MTNEAAEAKPQKRTPREKKEAANRVERTRENTDDKDCFTTALEKLKDCQEDDGFFILITTFKPEDAENDKVRGIAFIAESSSEFLVASHDKLVDVIKQDPKALIGMMMSLLDKRGEGIPGKPGQGQKGEAYGFQRYDPFSSADNDEG